MFIFTQKTQLSLFIEFEKFPMFQNVFLKWLKGFHLEVVQFRNKGGKNKYERVDVNMSIFFIFYSIKYFQKHQYIKLNC